ncbi:MAG: hypothetical protein ABUL68_00035 [Pseudomonadota bacterium]
MAAFVVLAAACPVVRAQPAPELTVRFTVFSAVPVEGLLAGLKPDAPREPVVFYPTARSPLYTYQGSNPLRFYRVRATGVAADPGFELAAEVVIPPTVHEALLLFAPVAPREGPRYRVYVLADGVAHHAPGWIAIINFSGLALGGTIEAKAVALKDGLNPPVNIGRSAKIVLRTPFNGRSYQSYADTVELGRGERALLILFPPYRAGSLEVQSRLLRDEPGG